MWDALVALLMLTSLEIVLGIDNIIFIAIIVARLPKEQQPLARNIGLGLALATRLLLLFALSWILGLKDAVFHLTDLGIPEKWLFTEDPVLRAKMNAISWRDIILFVGGLFLIAKSTYEIHDKLEGAHEKPLAHAAGQFARVMVQIVLLDIVFSLDSLFTAVGTAREMWVMVTAMIIAVGVMLVSAGPISNFVHRHPTFKILALSFLILIGIMLVAEAFDREIGKGYIYFAMTFSFVVELLNMRLRTQAPAVELHEPTLPPESPKPSV